MHILPSILSLLIILEVDENSVEVAYRLLSLLTVLEVDANSVSLKEVYSTSEISSGTQIQYYFYETFFNNKFSKYFK